MNTYTSGVIVNNAELVRRALSWKMLLKAFLSLIFLGIVVTGSFAKETSKESKLTKGKYYECTNTIYVALKHFAQWVNHRISGIKLICDWIWILVLNVIMKIFSYCKGLYTFKRWDITKVSKFHLKHTYLFFKYILFTLTVTHINN